MSWIKKMWNKLKNYRYKAVTVFVITIISGIIARIYDIGFFHKVTFIGFFILVLYILLGFFIGMRNVYKDGDKTTAIVLTLFVISAISIITYLYFTVGL